MKSFSFLAAVSLTAALSAGLLAGCGGGASGPTTAVPSVKGVTSSALFTVRWPVTTGAARSRLVPASAQSITVTVTKSGALIATQTINKPATTLLFTALPANVPLVFTATAYPQANAQGTAVASGVTTATLAQNTQTPIVLTMASTVKDFVIHTVGGQPIPPLLFQQSVQVVATAVDASGNTVLLAPGTFSWSVDNPTVASVVPVLDPVTNQQTLVATVTGLSTGTAHVTVTYNEDPNNPVISTPATVSVLTTSGPNTGRYAYVVNSGDNTLSLYTVSPTTGVLTALASPNNLVTLPGGSAPRAVMVDPTGRFVYVADNGNNSISIYSIVQQPTGVGTNITPAGFLQLVGNVPVGSGPVGIAIAPTDKFVYVVDSGSSDVYQFRVDPNTGALGSIGAALPALLNGNGQAISAGPAGIALEPSGHFLYVVDSASNAISIFSINTTTGALAYKGAVPTQGGTPESITFTSPDGAHEYAIITDLSTNQVESYSVSLADGSLTLTDVKPTGSAPVASAAFGAVVYVVNRDSATLSAYLLNVATGLLTEIAGSPFSTGGRSPVAASIDPSGSFLYVTNQFDNTASVFGINQSTGVLTQAVDANKNPILAVTGGSPGAVAATNGASGSLIVTAQ